MARQRSFGAFCISLLLLLLANALIPPPEAPKPPDRPLVVELIPQAADDAEPELPFLPQRIPEAPDPPPDKATVTDAFNRRVERETMARRSESKAATAPPTRPQAETESEPFQKRRDEGLGLLSQKLDLNLDFLDTTAPPPLRWRSCLAHAGRRRSR